ncbi:MAG: linearmycin/streptolysin transport system permease protein [Chloroflexota bacterium]|nr:linearmycin/streptolysin transport system permease protein [Chloroflexota bacterium]
MIQQIFATAWKDLKILFKDVGGLATLFFMPLMFILVMSTALQGLFDVGSDAQPVLLPVVNQDSGAYGTEIVAALQGMDGIQVEQTWQDLPLTLEQAEQLVTDGERQVVVYFPADFSAAIDRYAQDGQEPVDIQLIADPALSVSYLAPIQGMIQGAAERVVETSLAQDAVQADLSALFASLPANVRPALGDFNLESTGGSVIALKKTAPAGMQVTLEPDTYQQNVPGYTIMGVFFIVGTMATSILMEKREGTFRRLLVAPLPKGALLLGKILPYYLVNLIQIAIMFLTAHLLFGMGFGNLPALLVISLALAAAATGLGIMVAALGKTDTQVMGLTSLLTLTMSALGGCLMPTFIMPDFLQKISRAIPHAWAMQAFQDVLVRGYGVSGILPESLILLAFATVFFAIGVWRFRFD